MAYTVHAKVSSAHGGPINKEAYSGLVVHKQHYPMWPSLGELLHNLRQIDDGEEVPP